MNKQERLDHFTIFTSYWDQSPTSLRQLFNTFLVLLVCVMQGSLVSGQGPLPRIITAEDFYGRPTPYEPFDIEKDSIGYTYIVGRSGVLRFSGKSTVALPHVSKESSVIYSIQKDFWGKLWLLSGKDVSFIEQDSIYPFPLPDTIASLIKKRALDSFHRDSSGIIHIALRGAGYATINQQGQVNWVVSQSNPIHGFVATELKDGTAFVFSVMHKDSASRNLEVFYLDRGNELKKITRTDDSRAIYRPSIFKLSDHSFIMSTGNHNIIRFHRDTLIEKHLFPHRILELFVDRKENMWIGTPANGLFQAKEGNFSQLEHFLGNSASAVVAQGQNDGLWIKSDSIKFGYIPATAMPHFSERSDYPEITDLSKIVGDHRNVFFVSKNRNALYELQGTRIRKHNFPAVGNQDGVRNSSNFRDAIFYDSTTTHVWVGLNGVIAKFDGSNWQTYPLPSELFRDPMVMDITTLSDGRVVFMTRYHIYQFHEGKFKRLTTDPNNQLRELYADPEGRVWITGYDGLWLLANNNLIRPSENVPPPLEEFSYRPFYAHGTIWVQSRQGGLYRLIENQWEEATDQYNNTIRLRGYSVNASGDIWARTTRIGARLCKITFDSGKIIKTHFKSDGSSSIGGYEAYTILATDDSIYLGGNNGLFIGAIEKLEEEDRYIKAVIEQIHINFHPAPLKHKYSLGFDQNNIALNFNQINFRLLGAQFRYRFVGLDTTWVIAVSKYTQYTNLEPGDYQFEVQVRPKGGSWGKSTVAEFNIATPYWQTWWFRSILVLGGLLAVFGFIRYRSNVIQKREQQKTKVATELSKLELRALKAQINPHFIFNSITSVLYYMSSNNTADAENYLNRFAQLIRNVLENSENTSVSLHSELELMRHYVALESERFQGKPIEFKSSFEGIDPESVHIPPSLFQPYIENSIWHGLKQKKGSRVISLLFRKDANRIHVEITDNGIGREAAKSFNANRKGKRSFGMMIASRRIEVLNEQDAQKVKVVDLQNDAGEIAGTKVVFSIPLQEAQTVIPMRA